MIRWLLRHFGYYKIETGFSCGRHYFFIDGTPLAQIRDNPAVIYCPDEVVERLNSRLSEGPLAMTSKKHPFTEAQELGLIAPGMDRPPCADASWGIKQAYKFADRVTRTARQACCANCGEHRGKHSSDGLKCPVTTKRERRALGLIWHPVNVWTPKREERPAQGL